MPVGGRVSVSQIRQGEASFIRWFSFVGWASIIAGFPWLIWAQPATTFSIAWPILFTGFAPISGWVLGFRWGILPCFGGKLIAARPQPAGAPGGTSEGMKAILGYDPDVPARSDTALAAAPILT